MEAVRSWVGSHKARGCELFLFTDNSTAEAAFWKGTSKSRKLFDLVLELKLMEMEEGLFLHVIHVAGTCMIQQGTDGLSRADQSSGVMSGGQMLDHVPLDKAATVRSVGLAKGLRRLQKEGCLKVLGTNEWYLHELHGDVNVWIPPPAVCEVVAEELSRARQKQPEQMHIVVVPRLFTGRWRRRLSRAVDGYIVWTWKGVWDLETQHEPLLAFVAFPFRVHRLRHEERAELLEEFQGLLQEPQLQEVSKRERWNLLRKFVSRPQKV